MSLISAAMRRPITVLVGIMAVALGAMLALQRMRSVTGELLIVETHVDLLGLRRPAMAFYPGFELDGDWSNWWGPNPAAVIAMLEQAGFSSAVQVHPRTSLPGRAARALRVVRGSGGTKPRGAVMRQGRAVFHARV